MKADEPIQVLVPDAVAEFPFSSAGARRMFLEWETGSNPLAAEEKRNSLVTKLDRYARFLTDYAEALSGPTWYTKAFPDKWPARVRFVMHSERRKKNAVEVLSKWRERQTPRWKELDLEIATVAEVVAEMRLRCGLLPGRDSLVAAPGPALEHELRVRAEKAERALEESRKREKALTAQLADVSKRAIDVSEWEIIRAFHKEANAVLDAEREHRRALNEQRQEKRFNFGKAEPLPELPGLVSGPKMTEFLHAFPKRANAK